MGELKFREPHTYGRLAGSFTLSPQGPPPAGSSQPRHGLWLFASVIAITTSCTTATTTTTTTTLYCYHHRTTTTTTTTTAAAAAAAAAPATATPQLPLRLRLLLLPLLLLLVLLPFEYLCNTKSPPPTRPKHCQTWRPCDLEDCASICGVNRARVIQGFTGS